MIHVLLNQSNLVLVRHKSVQSKDNGDWKALNMATEVMWDPFNLV